MKESSRYGVLTEAVPIGRVQFKCALTCSQVMFLSIILSQPQRRLRCQRRLCVAYFRHPRRCDGIHNSGDRRSN